MLNADVKLMIHRRYIMRSVHLLHDRESDMFLKSSNIPSCPVSSSLACHTRFLAIVPCSLFRTCTVEGRIWYNGAVYVTREHFMPRKNCRHVESRQLISSNTPCVINDFVLFSDSARKGHVQKASVLKWMQMTMCISRYTRRPRNEVILISFIMQLLLRISFRSFSHRIDNLSRSFFLFFFKKLCIRDQTVKWCIRLHLVHFISVLGNINTIIN